MRVHGPRGCYGYSYMVKRNRSRSIPMAPELAARVERSAISLGLSFAERVRLALCREFGIPWNPSPQGRPARAEPSMCEIEEATAKEAARMIRARWDAMRAGADGIDPSACGCPGHAVAERVHLPGCPLAKARAARGNKPAA